MKLVTSLPTSPGQENVWSKIAVLFSSTLSQHEYKEFVKEYQSLWKEINDGRKTKLAKEQLQILRKRIEIYNSHVTGYQLLTPDEKGVEKLLEKTKIQPILSTQDEVFILPPEPEVERFIHHEASQSARLLHQINPLNLPYKVALECERESMIQTLSKFRSCLAEWKCRESMKTNKTGGKEKEKEKFKDRKFSPIPVHLELSHNARISSFRIGDVQSMSDLPSCVALPLFEHFQFSVSPPSSQGLATEIPKIPKIPKSISLSLHHEERELKNKRFSSMFQKEIEMEPETPKYRSSHFSPLSPVLWKNQQNYLRLIKKRQKPPGRGKMVILFKSPKSQ